MNMQGISFTEYFVPSFPPFGHDGILITATKSLLTPTPSRALMLSPNSFLSESMLFGLGKFPSALLAVTSAVLEQMARWFSLFWFEPTETTTSTTVLSHLKQQLLLL